MAFLTRESFLKQIALPHKDVDVPEMGGTVRVQGLTVAERTRFELAITTGKGQSRDVNVREMRESLLVMTLVNESGDRLLRDEDKVELGRLPSSVIEKLFDIARALSGMSDKDVKELGNA